MRLENITRFIGYIIIFSVNLFLYLFLHSHFYFMVLIIMLVSPAVSLVMAKYLRDKIDIEILPGVFFENDKNYKSGDFSGNSANLNEYGICGDTSYFYIKVNNPTYFVSLDAKLDIFVENTFFNTSGRQIVSVPIHMKSGYGLSFPVVATLPGLVKISVKSIKIKDLLGIFFFDKKDQVSGELAILPKILEEIDYDATSLQSGMLESEESTKKGNDFSDVQEIREYIPGDKLMSIHWKLSAKRDILMVKDRVSMSDRQLVVVPELCNADLDGLASVLEATYSVVAKMIKDKTTVRLMYFSKANYDYVEARIDYLSELNEAFVRMFYESTYEDAEIAAMNMANVHPEMKAFLHIYAKAGEAEIAIRENG